MRYFIFVSLALSLIACASSEDVRYYRLHPKALQRALKNCPDSHPRQIACAELIKIADEVNTLAYQLQRDPQGFGNTILTSEAKLAELERDFKKNKAQSGLYTEIAQEKQKIAEYLAIVQWLESPGK